MIKIDERDLYQLLIAEFRYAVKRDNHLAPSTCVEHVKNYLPEMTTSWRGHTAKQLSEEIIDERFWASNIFCSGGCNNTEFKLEKDVSCKLCKKQLNEDAVWEDLLVFLTDYLESMPHNVERYMTHIKDHMTYSSGIDFYSLEIHNKIAENLNKNNCTI